MVSALGTALAVGALIPLRSSISAETAALILVIPVALGVAIGGILVAPLSVVAGFIAFDVFFIPPYGTLRVEAGYHWVTLIAYAAVSVVVGGVVAQLYKARDVAEQREAELRIFYELADIVARAGSMDDALQSVAVLGARMFGLSTIAVLVVDDGDCLHPLASVGDRLRPDDLDRLAEVGRFPGIIEIGPERLMVSELSAQSGLAGVLAFRPAPSDADQLQLFKVFIAQAGVVIERMRLADEAAEIATLAEVDRLRSALMRSVSHDLRTPLASIKASISDLADESLAFDPSDRQTLLSTIEEETDRLTRFVANLLDMTRIESGGLTLSRSAIPLDEMIENIVVRFGRSLKGPVALHIPDDLPLADGDYTLIDQVLANLVENVIRHCPAGTPLTISAAVVDEWVEIRVTDEGPGIAGADQEHIFRLFYRGVAEPGGGGTGIGLAICAAVIGAHGGELWSEPNPGGGSAFIFRLPLAPVPTNDELEAPVGGSALEVIGP
ncbi:MAG: hypothetical protein NVS3B21_33130 [Acidimicrobiales bacterium]